MNEKIPFNTWSRERISQDRKWCTSRRRKYIHDKRVKYILEKIPWWFIKSFLYELEGADSPEELQQVIDDIFHRPILDYELFYVHFGNFKD